MPPVKKGLQKALKGMGLYQRLKASPIYDFYWKLADPRIIDEIDSEIAFYGSVLQGLRKGDLIFDIGANHGRKTDIFLKLGARVVAVDPDELNQEILKQKFLSYRFQKKPVSIVGKAVSDKSAVATFWIDQPGSGKNTLNRKWVESLRDDKERFAKALTFATSKDVATTTLDQLIEKYGRPFLIKIDVEGHEVNVLRGLKQPVPFLSFEVNLPEFKEEGIQCIKLLHGLSPNGTFNYTIGNQTGLALRTLLGENKFVDTFKACGEKCVEVFWRTIC